MSFWKWVLGFFRPRPLPPHLRLGLRGELVARQHLKKCGLKFLVANYRSPRGEIDMVFRDGDCLVFVEVKTRSSEDWARPADAVNEEKRRRLSMAALDYLRRIGNPQIRVRFDIVEVVFENSREPTIRHLPNAFSLTHPFRYG
ncbi:MAG TPA: YraN family protein [Verrucomicrobiota bacterium]|nr:YraN family protein [Verrucomicrobiota bacterium]